MSDQETNMIFKIGFALSKWPHFNSAYVLAVCIFYAMAVDCLIKINIFCTTYKCKMFIIQLLPRGCCKSLVGSHREYTSELLITVMWQQVTATSKTNTSNAMFLTYISTIMWFSNWNHKIHLNSHLSKVCQGILTPILHLIFLYNLLCIWYSHGKKDTHPYNLITIEMGSLWQNKTYI